MTFAGVASHSYPQTRHLIGHGTWALSHRVSQSQSIASASRSRCSCEASRASPLLLRQHSGQPNLPMSPGRNFQMCPQVRHSVSTGVARPRPSSSSLSPFSAACLLRTAWGVRFCGLPLTTRLAREHGGQPLRWVPTLFGRAFHSCPQDRHRIAVGTSFCPHGSIHSQFTRAASRSRRSCGTMRLLAPLRRAHCGQPCLVVTALREAIHSWPHVRQRAGQLPFEPTFTVPIQSIPTESARRSISSGVTLGGTATEFR